MSKYALVSNGIVDTISISKKPSDDWVEVSDDIFAGFILQDDGSFLPPEQPEPTREELYPPLAPWKFHAILAIAGLAESLEQILSSLDPLPQAVARAKIERVSEYHRDDPLVGQFSEALGKTSDEIDELWTQAHMLE